MTLKKLKHIAPILASLQNKETGFKVPETYFDTVENSVINKIDKVSLPKNTGYILPDNYFDTIEDKLLSKLNENLEDKQSVPENYFETFEDIVIERIAKDKKFISIKKLWIPTAIAASLVLMFSIYNPFSSKNNIEVAEVNLWIEEGYLGMSSYDIAEYFHPDLETLDLENTINKDDLENYIKNEFSEESFYN